MSGTQPLCVGILAGGATGEREVSLKTGTAVEAALRDRGHRTILVELGPAAGRPRWSVAGKEGSPLEVLAGPLAGVDVFFLALHGGAGEGGTLQGFLETLGLAYTGSGVGASALCLDKQGFLQQLEHAGLRTAPRVLVPHDASEQELRDLHAAALDLPGAEHGLVVKPRCGGSSVATTCLAPGPGLVGDLAAAIAAVRAQPGGADDAVVEVRIVGLEASCGVLEDSSGQPRALPPIEIRPKAGGFFDYEEKYAEDGALEFCPPVAIPEGVQARIQELAMLVHRVTGCAGYSRVDFMLPGLTVAGGGPIDCEPVLLESNTLPGLTPRSLLPKEAIEAGLSFGELCEAICHAGLRAHPRRGH
ncbi:MAG: hypothetical protein P1V81_01675 [Planctomycetota bacterium]|nr:hypothetical protein [Planctomycetota bacterium]